MWEKSSIQKYKTRESPLPPRTARPHIRTRNGDSMSIKGYIYAAIAAASYGTNPIFAIPLYREGMDVNSVLLMRYIMAVIMVGIMVGVKHPRELRLKPKEYPTLAFMGVLMVASSILLFESYRFLSAGIASTLLFFYPVMVALIMAALYHERLSRRSWICLTMAFLGVMTLSRDDAGGMISITGMLLVMLSSLSYAIYLVYINRGPMRNMTSSVVTFFVLVGGLAVLAVKTYMGGGLMIPPSPMAWFNVTGLGLFPTFVSLYFTSQAIDTIGSTKTAIFGALEPLTAVILGIIILGEALSLNTAIGMLLILVSVTVLTIKK